MRRSFRVLFRSKSRIKADIDEELEFHLAGVSARLRDEGWSQADADAEARRRFGDLEFTKTYCRGEDIRRERGRHRMTIVEELKQDLIYAIRGLRSSPGFTLVALATLALGIGANTAIFSVVRAVLLEPLPFATPDRIVRVWHANTLGGINQGSFSEPDFIDLQKETKLAESVGGYFFADGLTGVSLTGDGMPEQLSAALVTPGFFETLRPRTELGRVLSADEHIVGRNRAVVISHALWQRRFSGQPRIVGSSITLNRDAFTVVGVMPPGFSYPAAQALDVWIPVSYFGPEAIGRERNKHFISVVARLKPGVTLEQFHVETSGIAARLARAYPENPTWVSTTVRTIRESIVGDVRRPLTVLVAAVGMVLLVACVNIASLLLARASVRERELAVRAALGAGRGRIVRQLLTESLTLALFGAALGVGLAYVAVRALVASGGAQLPGAGEVHIDAPVLAFTLVIAVLAGLLFGSMPALRATSGLLMQRSLRAGGRGSAGRHGQRMRSTLVVIEVSLAVVLIAGAGLAMKSFIRLLNVNPGFRPDHAIVARITIPGTDSSQITFYNELLRTIRAIPGVVAAGSVRDLPTRGNGEMAPADRLGITAKRSSGAESVQLMHISTDFFKAMGAPLHGGREFELTDRAGAPFVVIVNEEFARRFFPGENVVGKTLTAGKVAIHIIGLAGNIRQRGLSEPVEPTMYLHAPQNMRVGMSIVARTTGNPLAISDAVRNAIWSLNRDLPISEVTTLDAVMGRSVARPKLLAWLLGVFGFIGLMLGSLGIYGVLAFAVAQRRQEIGVRVALGASPRSLLRLVVGQGMVLTLIGITIGTLGARVLTRQMQSMLFGVTPGDVATFVQVIGVLILTALLASWLPARRALSIDPVNALRSD
jgi:predicted permease